MICGGLLLGVGIAVCIALYRNYQKNKFHTEATAKLQLKRLDDLERQKEDIRRTQELEN